jgi:hypothetical protein
MANVDNARGFWPVEHLTGGDITRCREYPMTASATVYQGDLLKIVAGGTVEAAAADIGTTCIGVAAEYKVASATANDVKVLVYDDPYMVFGVQADAAVAYTDVGNTANHVAGTGSSTTLLSGHELDASDIDTGAQLKILGKIEAEDNTYAANVDLKVLINEHHYKAAVAKV